MQKPYVNCVMMTSIDGKIDGAFFEDSRAEKLGDLYEEIKLAKSDAWGNGSNTHLMYFNSDEVDFTKYKNTSTIEYKDNIIIDDENPYVVCFDQTGKVNWADKYLLYPDKIKNRVIAVLTKKVRPEYIAYLKAKEIPYIFAGEDKIDLEIALDKLYCLFDIKKFALTGGAKINGAFFKEDLIDEITLVVAPFVESDNTAKNISDTDITITKHFYLKKVKTLVDNGLLISYTKEKD